MLDPTLDAQIDAQLRQLRGRYMRTMLGQMTTLETALGKCRHEDLSAESWGQLHILAHKLAGTGTMYGFPRISEHAMQLDDDMNIEPKSADSVLSDTVQALLDACRAAQQAQGAQGNPAMAPAPKVLALPKFPPRGTMPPLKLPLILVADDDEAVCDMFKALIGTEAYVITAANSDEALRMMRNHQPDLLILDNVMPASIKGLKFLEKMKFSGEFAHIPVMMITASAAAGDIDRGMRGGAITYITKPFRPDVVLAQIRALLKTLAIPTNG